MVDRVKPLKIEGTGSGGSQNDDFPTSLNKNEDFVDCRGVTVQDDTSDDEAVRVSRTGDDMTFQDNNVAPVTLSALTSGGFDVNNVVWDVAGGIVYANDEAVVTKV